MMPEPEWRARVEARLAHLERHAGIGRDRPAEDRAAAAALAAAPPVFAPPLPFARPRAVEGGPVDPLCGSTPATMADDAELDRRLQAFLDIPGTEP